MARRLDSFPGEGRRGHRRYPWDEWTDGGTWEIRRGEDYDVPTENMRVSLHVKATSLVRKVRTQKVDDGQGEGLIFQFFDPHRADEVPSLPVGHTDETDDPTELLYRDALEIYERARREVTIPRKDGSRQKYAANRYKQQVERAHAEHDLVSAIARIVNRRTQGFGHLEAANRPDLTVETLVLDPSKPYHRLFPATTVQVARERMAEYAARHP
jgi:hypothetical protein